MTGWGAGGGRWWGGSGGRGGWAAPRSVSHVTGNGCVTHTHHTNTHTSHTHTHAHVCPQDLPLASTAQLRLPHPVLSPQAMTRKRRCCVPPLRVRMNCRARLPVCSRPDLTRAEETGVGNPVNERSARGGRDFERAAGGSGGRECFRQRHVVLCAVKPRGDYGVFDVDAT